MKALITGVTGAGWLYLAELLEKGYGFGIRGGLQASSTYRVDHLYQDPHEKDVRFFIHMEPHRLLEHHRIIRTWADEIYNPGAQSHVQVSFEPGVPAQSDAMGTLRILER